MDSIESPELVPVMTLPNSVFFPQSLLPLPAAEGATYAIRSAKGLVAELAGGPSQVSLALPLGRYQVERRRGANREIAQVELSRDSAPAPLSFVAAPALQTQAKGGPEVLEIFGGPELGSGLLAGYGAGLGVRLGVRRELGPLVLALHLHGAWNSATFASLIAPRISRTSNQSMWCTVFPASWMATLVASANDAGDVPTTSISL